MCWGLIGLRQINCNATSKREKVLQLQNKCKNWLQTWVKKQRLNFYHKYLGSYGVLHILLIWLRQPIYFLLT